MHLSVPLFVLCCIADCLHHLRSQHNAIYNTIMYIYIYIINIEYCNDDISILLLVSSIQQELILRLCSCLVFTQARLCEIFDVAQHFNGILSPATEESQLSPCPCAAPVS